MKVSFAAAVFISMTCASLQSGEACSPRPYGDVSAYLDAADDASRVGDFDLALSYANSARSAVPSLPKGVLTECGRNLADVYRDQARRRIAFVAAHGRSPAVIAAANEIPLVFPKTFNCP